MRVFVTGATGFVGSAVVRELLEAGHQVVGLARSDKSAELLRAVGADVHHGLLEDLDSLRRGAEAADGVIHAAFNNVSASTSIEDSVSADHRAIETLGAALSGSGRPFVVTSVIGLLPSGHIGTEEDAGDANAPGRHRIASEETALSFASRDVHVSVVRLPPSVHGDDDHGFVPALINLARSKGVSAYPGDGANRWSAVHRLDAAHLYRLALENGIAGARYHAVADEGVPVREIAQVIGCRLDVPVVSLSAVEVHQHFTWLAPFFSRDQAASSTRTQQQLGWQPKQAGLIADLEQGQYFDIPQVVSGA